jgi:hypothetical protein
MKGCGSAGLKLFTHNGLVFGREDISSRNPEAISSGKLASQRFGSLGVCSRVCKVDHNRCGEMPGGGTSW